MTFAKVLAGVVTASVIAGSAFAADLPARKSAPSPVFTPTPAYSWEGFYVGLDLGYGWESASNTYSYVNSNIAPNGIIGGAYLGYNMQVAPSFVLGLEGDIEGSGIRQSRNVPGLATAGFVNTGLAIYGNSMSFNNTFRASVRARAGLALDRALIYVTGGLAYAQFNTTMNWGNYYSETWSNGRAGWTIGTGLEYAFTNNWIGRLEYRFAQYGNFTRYSALAGYTMSQRVNDSAVRVGLAYKFGSGYSAPIVAKY